MGVIVNWASMTRVVVVVVVVLVIRVGEFMATSVPSQFSKTVSPMKYPHQEEYKVTA